MDAVVWRSATREVELLATPGTFIGITEDIDRVNVETTWRMDPGDVFVLLSDGVTEAEDSRGQPFGYEAVSALVGQHGVYCRSERFPGKPKMDIALVLEQLDDVKQLVQSAMEEMRRQRSADL
jgi:hypothetical protein